MGYPAEATKADRSAAVLILDFQQTESKYPRLKAIMPPMVPLAYKYVATAVMLMEINYCAARLHLSANWPFREQDVRKSFISGPMPVGGRFDFDQYSFSFATRFRETETKLRYITNLRHPFHAMEGGSPEMNAYLEGLTHVKSRIDANGAYQMATNWLERMEVDVAKLNAERAWTVTQFKWMRRDLTPIFEVAWVNNGERMSNGEISTIPGVTVMISGDTGELIHLRQEDNTFSKRPSVLIKDLDSF